MLGAAVAQASGGSALAGASGGVAGEYIAQQLYPGVDCADLSEEQRQTISALGTLAPGLAGGLAGDSAGSAVTGAQAGKNAVENNALSVKQNQSRLDEMLRCKGSSRCEKSVTDKYKEISASQHKEATECKGAVCVNKANEITALQSEYANRIEALGQKLRADGSLSELERNELIYLKAVLPQLEVERMTAIHNALLSDGSEEAKQLAINSIAQAGAAGAVGVAKKIGKTEKGSPLPVPNPVRATNGLNYQSNPKHTQ